MRRVSTRVLPGARAGDDEHRAAGVHDRLALLGIEPFEERRCGCDLRHQRRVATGPGGPGNRRRGTAYRHGCHDRRTRRRNDEHDDRRARATSENAEATEAWDGPLFDRFVQFKEVMTTGLGLFGTMALELSPPRPGPAACSTSAAASGTRRRQIAALVGPHGLGGRRSTSRRASSQASVEDAARNRRRERALRGRRRADRRRSAGRYDMAFSRFGTMFFANPVAALRNVRGSLVPGGRLVMIVWRAKVENDWMYRGAADRRAVRDQAGGVRRAHLRARARSRWPAPTRRAASWSRRATGRSRSTVATVPIVIGRDMDEAISLDHVARARGEILRLAGDRAAHLHGDIDAALRDGLAEYEEDGVMRAPASVWIVTATAP